MTHACNMNVGDVSQDPRPPPRITCQWTVAWRWACGYLRNAAGSLPQSWHAALAFHAPGVHWNAGSGVPSTHSLGSSSPGAPLAAVTAGSFRQHPHPPTTERNPRANSASWARAAVNSEALLTSQVLCGLRGLHALAGVKVESPRLYYLPSVSSCSGMRQQKQQEQHSVNYVGDLSARSLSPLSWASFSKSTRISEQSSHPAPETRRCPPLLVTRAPRLATHWRLSSNSMLVLPLCYFLFYIYKKIYKQRYQLAAVDIIITTCKWWHSPRAQEVIPVNIHTPSCLCARYLEIPVTLSQQTCGIHEQVSSFWYILPYLSDGRSSLLQLD